MGICRRIDFSYWVRDGVGRYALVMGDECRVGGSLGGAQAWAVMLCESLSEMALRALVFLFGLCQ
jgi:hypothetical protein